MTLSFHKALLFHRQGNPRMAAHYAVEANRRYSEQGKPVPRFIAVFISDKVKAINDPSKPEDKPKPPPTPSGPSPAIPNIKFDPFIDKLEKWLRA